MAKITCPLCSHLITIKDLKPGRHTPSCSACNEPFRLVVDELEGQPRIRVGRIPAKNTAGNEATQIGPPIVDGKTPAPDKSLSETFIDVNRSTDAVENPPESERRLTSSSPNTGSRDSRNIDDKTRPVESSPDVAETFIAKVPQKNRQSNAAAPTEFSLDSGLAGNQQGAKVDEAASELMRLQRLGGYRLLSVLGRGAWVQFFLRSRYRSIAMWH